MIENTYKKTYKSLETLVDYAIPIKGLEKSAFKEFVG